MASKRVAANLESHSPHIFISSGGEMGRLIREFDWSQTSLGALSQWSESILAATNVCVNSKFEICLWLGSDLIFVYNDAYISSLATKHPIALGKPGREVWWDIWDTVGPMLRRVVETGEPTFSEDLLLEMQRRGFKEETYYTFSYSPIIERGEIKGVFTALKETTERVVGERRLRTLRELGQEVIEAKTPRRAVEIAAEVISRNDKDLPFALIYILTTDGVAELVSHTGLQGDSPNCPLQADFKSGSDPWQFERVISSKEAVTVDSLPANLALQTSDKALVVPIPRAGSGDPYGILVAGISSYRPFDEGYKTFVGLVAAQVATAIANASALEEQRERAESLAKIDRAKTIFFSNVSHEFRTPLTLIVGPLEGMIEQARPAAIVSREELQLVHRNSLRLLKLVNTLLDFSRIEAGRVEAIYEPTDLSTFTSDTASAFRSAMEQAGLEFVVDCESSSEPAYVDRDMWEKIVLNLISNAFKFTLAGRVTVHLRSVDERIELRVEDTGLGIPEEEQSKVFERFHRIEGMRGRTHEGTGIGLALVQELVKLHHGSIRVESAPGTGSKFIVSIPKEGIKSFADGQEVKQRMLKSTGVSASAYVNEALLWLPETQQGQMPEVFASDSVQAPHIQTTTGRILLADDNADMRQYIRRLLGDNYAVDAVSNGIEALSSIRNNTPDLVLTDVMMPGLDGFGLLRELRAKESTKTIPVILLSARAGEDARIEGMQAGADDYMVKPFTARELLARVGAHLAMGRLRREVAERERSLRAEAEVAHERTSTILESISDSFFALDPEWKFTYVNAAAERTLNMGRADLLNRRFWDVFPPTKGTNLETQYRRAMSERTPIQFENYYLPWNKWYDVRLYPASDGGISVFYQDITERKKIELAARESEERLRTLAQGLETRVQERTAELERLNEELHDLSSRLQQVQDEERRNLARALHDSAGQLLAAVAMNIDAVRSETYKLSPEVARKVEENAEIIQQLSSEIRTVSHLLHPPLLDEVGLSSALRWYVEGFAQRSKIATTLDMPETLERYSTEMEIAIFRVVQECLTNVHRHSGCRSCIVNVFQNERHLNVEVRDDGKGIPNEKLEALATAGGVGLRGIMERVRRLGGNLAINSSQKGTQVVVTLPIHHSVSPECVGAA